MELLTSRASHRLIGVSLGFGPIVRKPALHPQAHIGAMAINRRHGKILKKPNAVSLMYLKMSGENPKRGETIYELGQF
jgi:hypothetical protein